MTTLPERLKELASRMNQDGDKYDAFTLLAEAVQALQAQEVVKETKMTHLLFAGHSCYPRGGIDDLVARGTVDELKVYFQDNAKRIARDGGYIRNWGQIFRVDTLECVLWGELDNEINDLSEPGLATWHDTPPYER